MGIEEFVLVVLVALVILRPQDFAALARSFGRLVARISAWTEKSKTFMDELHDEGDKE